jgi:hypothetical protein
MKYIYFLIGSFFTCALIYWSPLVFLYPAPVMAEYWIREMMVIKRHLALPLVGQKKIIVAAGSNVLFSVDTNMISAALGRPALNLGLTASLPLTFILQEVDRLAEKDDIVILPLEPDYYCREDDNYKEWNYRNGVAWYPELWRTITAQEHLAAPLYLDPLFPLEILTARIAEKIRHPSVSLRVKALDDQAILKKYREPKDANESIYSIYNVDSFGNIKNTADSHYRGKPRRADSPLRVCAETIETLRAFAVKMQQRGVATYLAHTPWVEIDNLDMDAIKNTSDNFNTTMSSFLPVLDSMSELIFKRNLFLDTDKHLNSVGRELRTKILIKELNRYILDQNKTVQ